MSVGSHQSHHGLGGPDPSLKNINRKFAQINTTCKKKQANQLLMIELTRCRGKVSISDLVEIVKM